MSANKHQDYIGFTFNGRHSSEFGIVRTSDGSRFNENLLPTIQDKTVQVPGGDGTYYFGSYYTQRVFNISFAFDSLTEEQFAGLKRWLGDKKIHDLIFDELPYKIYSAKITGSATIKHIPFSEGDTNRVYKGEGSIQFTAYTPFARSRYKWLDDYQDFPNKDEWAKASGLKKSQENFDKVVENTDQSYKINVYNPGVIESDFHFKIKFNDNGKIPRGHLSIYSGNELLNSIGWSEITANTQNEAYIKINSKINLIEGYNASGGKTGQIYNKYITSGEFFKIPLGSSAFSFGKNLLIEIGEEPIEYNYYYF